MVVPRGRGAAEPGRAVSSGGRPETLETVIAFAAVIIYVVAGTIFSMRRSTRYKRLYDAEVKENPALRDALDIKAIQAAPEEWKSRLDGKVVAVNAVMGGSFITDSNGETHDLESGHDADDIATNARWLADLLGVPFNNDSRGHAMAALPAASSEDED